MPKSKTRFHWAAASEGIAFRLRARSGIGRTREVPVPEWSRKAEGPQLTGVGRLLAWVEEETATADDFSVQVPHRTIADLAESAARALGLPPAPELVLNIQHAGTIDRPGFRITATWLQPTLQPAVGLRRVGCILYVGKSPYRLPQHLYGLIEAVERFNALETSDREERLKAIVPVQKYLPSENTSSVTVDNFVRNTRIAHAAAFSISFGTRGDEFAIDPVLFGPNVAAPAPDGEDDGGEAAEPIRESSQLLPPVQNRHFAEERFPRYDACRPAYPLKDGWYVVLDENVRRALTVVRRVQQADRETRREFVRNPRAFLRREFGDDLSEAEIDLLFVETAEYSARIQDVGLWQGRVLPWIRRPGDKWMPETFGLYLEGKYVQLEKEDIPPLRKRIEQAIRDNIPQVEWNGKSIPATPNTLNALDSLGGIVKPNGGNGEGEGKGKGKGNGGARRPVVLIIEDNLDELGFARRFEPRGDGPATPHPLSVRTPLKPHQTDGFEWLKTAWRCGRPGVLLADDMGLGKTLQALTFLAWLRQAMEEGKTDRAPILIVAPTGLLKNWEQEHDRHLTAPGLGNLRRAYGPDLRALRQDAGREIDLGQSVLDVDRLREADWLLTTYETLRDYQHSFATIRFAAIVFDEIQKTKTPGTVMTHAAKAMNGDFVVALTGTPIENRLADLWCIVDTVEPGRLGDLAAFSREYEREEDPERLRHLKKIVSDADNGIPPLMLRRMKTDHLEGLPEKKEHVLKRAMPDIQAKTYADAVAAAQAGGGPGKMLKALHMFKSISLHPIHPDAADKDYVSQSARLALAFEVLDKVRDRGEKALIFVESLDMHHWLAGAIKKRYRLDKEPMVISGQVTGTIRLDRVNAFQESNSGFDVMILSPRAGGVGLTLTAANHVIHLSRWWNPAVEDQCTDRVYRIGQEKPIHVYYPLALHPDFPGHSFDETLNALLERKRALSREMLLPPVNRDKDTQVLFDEIVGNADAEAPGTGAKEGGSGSVAPLDEIDAMEPEQFEEWVLQRMKDRGFVVDKTPKSWDAGADGIATDKNSGREIIIQCKHTQSDTLCDQTAVEQLLKARRCYDRPSACLVAVTNARDFTDAAKRLAGRNEIWLCARERILDWPDCLPQS